VVTVITCDAFDLKRANRIRNEYGKVSWLISWDYDPELRFWLTKLSCPKYHKTVEGIGQSRCTAIDSATRYLLDCLHKQQQEEKIYEQNVKDLTS
jgi:hypothetical protein